MMPRLFDELDDVPWASMKHAYGTAEEVPDLLRGLLSDDEYEREIALDGFYGAVHHQGSRSGPGSTGAPAGRPISWTVRTTPAPG